MNRRTSSIQFIEQAIKCFLYYKSVKRLTDRTIDSYQRNLSQWAAYERMIKITQITICDIFTYLTYLRTDFVPRRFRGEVRTLLSKTIRNV